LVGGLFDIFMKLENIQITYINPQGSLIGFGSCVFEDLWIGHIAIHTKPDGSIRLVFPARKVKENNLQVFYPITDKLNKALTLAFAGKNKEINLFQNEQ